MSDIVFDNTEQITVLCNDIKIQGSDFLLDSPGRRSGHGGHLRRALVHDQADGLTINFNGDYPGGVTIVGVKLLDVHGDVRLTIKHMDFVRTRPVFETVNLTDFINLTRQEIAALKAQVATLTPKP